MRNKVFSKHGKSSQITQDELKIARVKTGSGVLEGGGKIFLKKIKIENYDALLLGHETPKMVITDECP
jgi:hypothetical protein